MKRDEYKTELKSLYGKAIESKDYRLALDILELGLAAGLEDICSNDDSSEGDP